jgi:hypothetical protein
MPPRPKYQARFDEAIDRAVDLGIDRIFEKATDFFTQGVDNRRAAMAEIPQNLRRSAYKCSGCHNMFPFEQCAMVSAKGDGYATCERCFKFMWHAGNEKMLLMKEAAKQAAHGARRAAPSPGPAPRAPKPWVVLGVSEEATIEEIKKAYRKLAAATHPDIVPPGAPAEEREAARARFEEITRAYEVMMKLWNPAR